MSRVHVELLPLHPELGRLVPVPARMSDQAAGFDLAAALDAPVSLAPGERRLIGCGFAMALPPGYEAQTRPRSGLAVRHGIGILNSPGTIDADYRGEVKILLVNLGSEPFVVEPGMRIAQMVIAPVVPVELELVVELAASARGAGGFGSTGT